MSKVISASSEMLVGLVARVVAVAAVVLVFSFASILSLFAPRILVPLTLISTVGKPLVDAVFTDALGMLVIVMPNGARIVTLDVPVVMAVDSSLRATVIVLEP
jgi:hypothetical protein